MNLRRVFSLAWIYPSTERLIVSHNLLRVTYKTNTRTYARFQNTRESFRTRTENLVQSERPTQTEPNILPIKTANIIEESNLSIKEGKHPESNIIFTPATHEDVDGIARELKPTFNMAAYVNQSESLQQLVKLGVDLSKLERNHAQASYVLQLNFDKDVKPYIQFLHDNGVLADNIGHVLTKNITICQQSLDDLQVRLVNHIDKIESEVCYFQRKLGPE